MKDHEFRELVNTLRDVALQYHNHESLRERIRRALSDALKKQKPVAYQHRDGMLSSRLPGGPVLGIDWTPLYATPVPPSVPDELPTEEMTTAFASVFNVYKQKQTFGPAVRAMLAAAPQPERAASNSIGVEAVCVVVDGLDGKRIDWLIEGGLGDLPEGTTLIFAHQAITGEDGWGEVFLAAPQPERKNKEGTK